MVTAFMDMVGILMIVPLMPFYAKSMGAGGFVVGLLVASFSVAQLLMAPVWGRLSDHYGRRPALIVGMTASAIAYVIFAYAGSLWLLFLSRVVQGAGGGSSVRNAMATTLGYGDVLPLPHWHLLGPMTALNGIMLIGWSTALIIEILRRSGNAPAQSATSP